LRLFTYTSEPTAERTDFPNPHAQGVAPNHQSVIASWKVSSDGSEVDPGSRKELMRIDQPQFNHNGGMIAVGPDGFLYIGMGDGGGANDIGPGHNPEIGNSQDLKVVLGKMLRIDVNGSDSRNGAYGIPKDNPFASRAGGAAAEIYALGLRNPFRFSFDGPRLIVGDVGQNKLEMVYEVGMGGNYGWRVKEGSFQFNINGTIENFTPGAARLTNPLLQYDRDEGTSVMGGHVYRGKAIPALSGRYVFGDYQKGGTGTGRLFVGDLSKGTLQELRIGADERPLGFLLKGFGQTLDGELYAVGSAQAGPSGTRGVVVKIVPSE
jgi:glucose/arabinose dehydrogenase